MYILKTKRSKQYLETDSIPFNLKTMAEKRIPSMELLLARVQYQITCLSYL